jgi:hypothetical protein
MAKHQDDDAILIQATTTGKRNITPESSPASSCKGRASRHGPKAIFGPKLLKTTNFKDSESLNRRKLVLHHCKPVLHPFNAGGAPSGRAANICAETTMNFQFSRE